MKLTAWAEASEEGMACRPFCVLLINLHPLTRVFGHKLMHPPDVLPTTRELLTMVLEEMREPKDGGTPHKPQCLVFSGACVRVRGRCALARHLPPRPF